MGLFYSLNFCLPFKSNVIHQSNISKVLTETVSTIGSKCNRKEPLHIAKDFILLYHTSVEMSTFFAKKYFAKADKKSKRQKFNLQQLNLLVRDGHQDGGMHKSFKAQR